MNCSNYTCTKVLLEKMRNQRAEPVPVVVQVEEVRRKQLRDERMTPALPFVAPPTFTEMRRQQLRNERVAPSPIVQQTFTQMKLKQMRDQRVERTETATPPVVLSIVIDEHV